MKVALAGCGGDQGDAVYQRVLAGECKDVDDNPTCLDDGPCLDHGGFDFAAQNLVSRTPTGGLRIDFPVGYDEATWGLLYVLVCAAPKTCTSLSVIEPGAEELCAQPNTCTSIQDERPSSQVAYFSHLKIGFGDGGGSLQSPALDFATGTRGGLSWEYFRSKLSACPEGTLDFADDPDCTPVQTEKCVDKCCTDMTLPLTNAALRALSLIHISEPTRP